MNIAGARPFLSQEVPQVTRTGTRGSPVTASGRGLGAQVWHVQPDLLPTVARPAQDTQASRVLREAAGSRRHRQQVDILLAAAKRRLPGYRAAGLVSAGGPSVPEAELLPDQVPEYLPRGISRQRGTNSTAVGALHPARRPRAAAMMCVRLTGLAPARPSRSRQRSSGRAATSP